MRDRISPFRVWITKPIVKWFVAISLASSVATLSMRTHDVAILAQQYSPDVRVWMDNAVIVSSVLVNNSVVVAWHTLKYIDAFTWVSSVHDRIVHVLSYIASYLAVGMVFAEIIRGGRELFEYVRRPSSDNSDAERPHKKFRSWSKALAVVAPCLIAVLYYGVHATIT
jgi:hypothetical protein